MQGSSSIRVYSSGMCAPINSRKGMKVCGERPLNDTALARDFLDKLDRSIYAEMLRDYCNGLVTKVTTLEEAYQLAKNMSLQSFHHSTNHLSCWLLIPYSHVPNELIHHICCTDYLIMGLCHLFLYLYLFLCRCYCHSCLIAAFYHLPYSIHIP